MMDSDSIPVEILKVSNPVSYTIKNLQITDEKLDDLEKELGRYFENACSDKSRNETIEKNHLVIVYLIEENKHVRGLIKCIVRGGDGVNYIITLLDYGKSSSTKDKSSMRRLPDKFVYDLPFRTPYLTLPNLEPLARQLTIEDDIKLCLTKSDDWTKAALDYCTNTLNKFNWRAEATILQIESPYTYVGQLHFSHMNCMNDMLLSSNYAISTLPKSESVDNGAEQLNSNASDMSNNSYETIYEESYQQSSKEDSYQQLSPSYVAHRSSNTSMSSLSSESLWKMYPKPNSGLSIHEKMKRKALAKAKSKSNSSIESVKDATESDVNSEFSIISHHSSETERAQSLSDSHSNIGDTQNTTPKKCSSLTSQTLSNRTESSPSPHTSGCKLESSVINDIVELCSVTHQSPSSGSSELTESNDSMKHQSALAISPHVKDDYDKLAASDYCKVLTFGHTILPLWEINKFEPYIVKALRNVKIEIAKPIQKYSWPAIHRGFDATLIGTKGSGKSLSYLLPIFSLLDTLEEKEGSVGNGPTVLILCSSFSTVSTLYNMCQAILNQPVILAARLIRVIKLFSVELSERDKGELINGCQILISTPTVINHFISQERSCIQLNQLQYIVFEEAEALFTEKEMKQIFKIYECCQKTKNRGRNFKPKFILCSKKWTQAISAFCSKVMSNPVIYIEDLLEASHFINMDFNIITTLTHKKENELIELLHRRPEMKTVVFANTKHIDHLKNLLETQSLSVLVARNGMNKGVVTSAVRNWMCGITKYIFVVDDSTYEEVKITDAFCLIHYDPPAKPQIFRDRFNVLLDEMQLAVEIHSGNLKERIAANCSTHVILTKEDGDKANFFRRCFESWGRKVPLGLQTIAEKRVKEKENPSLPICDDLKTFGRCNNRTCRSRHIFYSLKNIFYPDNGTVVLKIIKIHCANRYKAHIISIDSDAFLSRYSKLNVKLQAYFSQSSNRVTLEVPKVGKLAAVKSSDDSFIRVKILEVDSGDVKVCHIDMGNSEVTNADRLLVLPVDFQELPPQAVEIVLANVQPIDESLTWQLKPNMFVSELILNVECEGSIVKSYDNIIWLKSLRKVKKLSICSQSIEVFRLPKRLINEKLAIENPNHMELLLPKFQLTMQDVIAITGPNLEKDVSINSELHVIDEEEGSEESQKNIKLANERDVEIINDGKQIVNDNEAESENDEQSKLISVSPQIQLGKRWTELGKLPKPKFSIDKLKMNILQSVYVPYVESPSSLYIQNSGDALEELNKEINSTELELVKGSIAIGEFYLAPFGNDKQYFRSQAVGLLPDNRVKVFWLDVGDTTLMSRDQLRTLDRKFLELPFQAMRCSLTGIGPCDGNSWCANAGDELWENVIDSAFDSMEVFALVTCELKPKKLFDVSYEVVLFNFERTIILNELLVAKNLARLVAADFSQYKSYLLPDARDSAVYSESELSEIATCNSPGLIHQQSVPAKVLWFEKGREVVLKVMLNDVGDYKLNVLDQRVEFSCMIGSDYFCNNMDLFAPIDPEKYQTTVYASNVSIKLSKASGLRWRNLLAHEKPYWLKYDVDYIDVSDSDISTQSRYRVVKKCGGRLPRPRMFGSDSSSYDDDSDGNCD